MTSRRIPLTPGNRPPDMDRQVAQASKGSAPSSVPAHPLGSRMSGSSTALPDWQRNIESTLSQSLAPGQRPSSRSHSDITRDTFASDALRFADSIREDTPSPTDEAPRPTTTYMQQAPGSLLPRDRTPTGQIGGRIAFGSPASPRSIPGGEKSRDRRLGLVFDDKFDATDASDSSFSGTGFASNGSVRTFLRSPSPTPQSDSRPRTRTLDGSRSVNRAGGTRARASITNGRPEAVAAVQSPAYDEHRGVGWSNATTSTPGIGGREEKTFKSSSSLKDKCGRKLQKKTSIVDARTSSTILKPSPTIGFLSAPLPTNDANKILHLMRDLKGRMRGAVDYQIDSGKWQSGLFYVDDIKHSLLCEGDDHGPFYHTIIPDLRDCRIEPSSAVDRQHAQCLDITSAAKTVVRIMPLLSTEYDHWLAALLCWQQIWPSNSVASPTSPEARAKLDCSSGSKSVKEISIIKVGKLLLWTREIRLSSVKERGKKAAPEVTLSRQGAWQRVSCILQDNGELKLVSEIDFGVLAVIQLSQLSRCAVQRLDRSVLGEEFSMAIFPQYTTTSTALSIIRPVYIALEQRVLFEVWYVLLRGFAVPEIYGSELDLQMHTSTFEDGDSEDEDMFRISRKLTIRVTEAKMKRAAAPEEVVPAKHVLKEKSVDPLVADYFVELIADGEVRLRTPVRSQTRTPFWRSEVELEDLPASFRDLSFVLKCKVALPEMPDRHHHLHGHRSSGSISITEKPILDIPCGVVHVRIQDIQKMPGEENWWPIYDEQQEKVGDMFMRLTYDETAILMSKDYTNILQLLQQFDNGLSFQIAQAMPTKLRPLSEVLVNIFQVSGSCHNWLMALVEEEIDGIGEERPSSGYRFSSRVGSHGSSVGAEDRESFVRDVSKSLTGEANLLFRGNSLLTQAVDFHMRRIGKDYLEDVLKERLMEIDEVDALCEVDPSRLGAGDSLDKNWAQLMAYTNGIWVAIAASPLRCPAQLRQILKFIRSVADARYGDFLRTVPYTAVSGFLFLRFFCPAILNPTLFALLPDHPRPRAQRTLTLVAKSLQALANLSTFGQKEAWMEPMNKFLGANRQSLRTYIDTITSISSEDRSNLPPASYLTPVTILSRLSPTSREGFPSLPYLIDQAHSFATLVNLWLTATAGRAEMGPWSPELRTFHKLCVDLQRRTDDCLHRANIIAGDNENMSTALQWDELVTSFDQAQLSPSNTSIYSVGSDGQSSRPPTGRALQHSTTLNAIASPICFSPQFGNGTTYPLQPVNTLGVSALAGMGLSMAGIGERNNSSATRTSFSSGGTTATSALSEHRAILGQRREIRRAGSESERDSVKYSGFGGSRIRAGFWEKLERPGVARAGSGDGTSARGKESIERKDSKVRESKGRSKGTSNSKDHGSVATADKKADKSKSRDRVKEFEKERARELEMEKERDRATEKERERAKDRDSDQEHHDPEREQKDIGRDLKYFLGMGHSKRDRISAVERERLRQHEEKKGSIEIVRSPLGEMGRNDSLHAEPLSGSFTGSLGGSVGGSRQGSLGNGGGGGGESREIEARSRPRSPAMI